MDFIMDTIEAAERIVRGLMEPYPVQPTDEQVKTVAQELFAHVGKAETFNLDAALARAGY